MQGSVTAERIFTWDFIWTCFANLAVYCGFYLMLATLPLYLASFGASQSEIGLVAASFAASAVFSRLLAGGMVAKRGTRGLMVLGAGGALVAAGLFAVANDIPFLLAARLLHGAGVGCIATAASVLIAEIAPARRRGEAMGYFGVSTNLAMAVGPAVGVMLASSFGFMMMFLVAAGFGLLATIGSFVTHDHHGHPEQLALDQGWRGFLSPPAFFPSIILGCFTIAYGAVTVFLPLMAEERQIGNPGLFFAVYAIALLVVRGPLGGASDRWGRGIVIAPGLIGMAIALFVLSSASSLVVVLAVAALFGVSVAAMQPALQAMVVDRAKPHERNAAMGTFTTAWDLGTGLGSFIWGVVAQAAGFEAMYIWAGALGIVGLVVLIGGGGLRRTLPVDEAPIVEN